MTSMTDQAELLASLERHNTTFTTLLSLIPSRFYAAPDPDEADSRWMKNKKRKTGEEIKESKRRAKHEKLDPANNLTAADLINDVPNGVAEATAGPSKANGQSPNHLQNGVRPLPPAASISEIRARLHSKIEGFRKDRGLDDSDPQSRDALESEQRRRRGEMRDRRRKERKEDRRKEREKEQVTAKTAKTVLPVPHPPRSNDKVTYQPINLPSSSSSSHKTNFKPISNPSHALAHLEKHKRKLEGMSEDKRREAEERERWAKAQERAAGGKVADQESTLRKAVKRKEKEKSKSGKEWSERKRDLDKSQAIAMKKRTDHIAVRAEARRNKRLGIKDKGKKKKQGRPGFEGGRKKKKDRA